MTAPAVLGIDPSLTATGLALPDGSTRTIKYTPRTLSGDARLLVIYEEIMSAVVDHGVSHAMIEDLPSHAKSAGLTGRSQGVVRLALVMAGVPYGEVIPSSLKKFATGSGTAQKPDMRMELYKRTGIDLKDDNQMDAYWLRQMGLHHLGFEEFSLPKLHTDSLAKVKWPEDFVEKQLVLAG